MHFLAALGAGVDDHAMAAFGIGAAAFLQGQPGRQGQHLAQEWRMGFIDKARLLELAKPLAKNDYGKYLYRIAGEKI